MTKNPNKSRSAGTRTGTVPRIDVEPEKQHEPPEPPELPEIHDDSGSITGMFPFAAEGEDEAKNSDDSSTTHKQLQ